MEILVSTKSKRTEHNKRENVLYLEITKVVLIHFNLANNSYQQISRVLHTLVPNKSFGQLVGISPKNFILLKTFEVTKK